MLANPCAHAWRAAPDGLVSCEHCGKIYIDEPNWADWGMPSIMLRCECGGAKAGYSDFAPGHSPWCPVRAI